MDVNDDRDLGKTDHEMIISSPTSVNTRISLGA
jgi:hypothetical protein